MHCHEQACFSTAAYLPVGEPYMPVPLSVLKLHIQIANHNLFVVTFHCISKNVRLGGGNHRLRDPG